VDATLALVLPRDIRAVRLRRWQRMGCQPLPDEGGLGRVHVNFAPKIREGYEVRGAPDRRDSGPRQRSGLGPKGG